MRKTKTLSTKISSTNHIKLWAWALTNRTSMRKLVEEAVERHLAYLEKDWTPEQLASTNKLIENKLYEQELEDRN